MPDPRELALRMRLRAMRLRAVRLRQNGSPVEAIGTERSPVVDYTCGSLGQGSLAGPPGRGHPPRPAPVSGAGLAGEE